MELGGVIYCLAAASTPSPFSPLSVLSSQSDVTPQCGHSTHTYTHTHNGWDTNPVPHTRIGDQTRKRQHYVCLLRCSLPMEHLGECLGVNGGQRQRWPLATSRRASFSHINHPHSQIMSSPSVAFNRSPCPLDLLIWTSAGGMVSACVIPIRAVNRLTIVSALVLYDNKDQLLH